jgi:hypothetical protein
MIPMGLRLLVLMLRLALGLLLFYATLSLFVALARSPQIQQLGITCGMLLAVLWILWSKLPDWSREALRNFWIARRHNDDE